MGLFTVQNKKKFGRIAISFHDVDVAASHSNKISLVVTGKEKHSNKVLVKILSKILLLLLKSIKIIYVRNEKDEEVSNQKKKKTRKYLHIGQLSSSPNLLLLFVIGLHNL